METARPVTLTHIVSGKSLLPTDCHMDLLCQYMDSLVVDMRLLLLDVQVVGMKCWVVVQMRMVLDRLVEERAPVVSVFELRRRPRPETALGLSGPWWRI